ncbi:MAG: pyridoxamine 5'-phosphate oxidase family protein [Lachnospiraceae bacterium]|nr:pyridoxamine 5'-phosphate oxidase family protein [Lachnospiraceae bacterium]
MFRKMRRFKQQLSDEECIAILKNEKRGVLSLMGEDGYPYGMPMNHWYCEDDGKLYFHGAKEGHKIDAIKANPKASFCVYDSGYKNPGEWALNVKSVIVFGEIKLVEDIDVARKICTRLVEKFTDDEEYLEKELKNALSRVQCLEFTPVHMTGKLVNES